MTSRLCIQQVQGKALPKVFEQIARIHQEEISTGFLSTLGSRFLTMLYRALAESRHSLLFAAIRNGTVVGFICGSLNTKMFCRQFLRRRGIPAAIVLVPKLFKWSRIKRVLETLLYPRRSEAKRPIEASLPSSEVLNFCVSKRFQGQGIGRRLFEAMCAELARHGVERIKIVTGAGQEKARRFYEKAHATFRAHVQVHRGKPSVVYLFDIKQEKQHVQGTS